MLLPSSAVIAQTLCTRWSAKSRGAAAAVRRSDTPQRLPLNLARLGTSALSWHDVELREPHFLPVEAYRERELPARLLRVELALSSERLVVSALGSERFQLCAGQTGIIVYNLTCETFDVGAPSVEYQQAIVHLAYGMRPSVELFARAPEESYVSIRNL